MKHIFFLQESIFIIGIIVAFINMNVDDPFWDVALTGVWGICMVIGFSMIAWDLWVIRKKHQWQKQHWKKFMEEEREEAEQ